MAKRDLAAGEVLDGIGGFTCYGVDRERGRRASASSFLPMGLSEGCELVADVGVDQPIRYQDVRVPEGRIVDGLRREQDELFAGV